MQLYGTCFGALAQAFHTPRLLTLTAGTNQASATVNPNFSGQSLTFDGYLVPYDQSTVFQGMTQW